ATQVCAATSLPSILWLIFLWAITMRAHAPPNVFVQESEEDFHEEEIHFEQTGNSDSAAYGPVIDALEEHFNIMIQSIRYKTFIVGDLMASYHLYSKIHIQ
ncbi:hypothetical protein ACJX0J_027852, partial [Zea mays]